MGDKMARSLSEAAKYVLERFKHYGIDVPASSRFMRMHSALCNDDGSSRGYISEDDSLFETAREALRDISQLEFFFDQIKHDPEKGKYAPIIKRIIRDSVLPQDNMKNSYGRDAQAEAFGFAVCRNAGMNPVFEEPDVTCTTDKQRTGIAVKRIKSRSQLEKRLKEAAKQIQKTSLPGIVSVEVTLAVNPKNLTIVTNQDEGRVRRWWEDKQRKTVEDWDPRLRQTLGSKGVLGVFLHEHCPVRLNGNYVFRSMTYGIETASNSKRVLWAEFWKEFVQGLPDLQR